jgi:hypothetical protein
MPRLVGGDAELIGSKPKNLNKFPKPNFEPLTSSDPPFVKDGRDNYSDKRRFAFVAAGSYL